MMELFDRTNRDIPILMVEDDSTDALMIRRALTKAGVANPVLLLSDGDAAVTYLAGQSPYHDRQAHPLPVLLLLDLKLPRRSGFEVLTWVRQQPRLKRIPVIMLTSSNQTQDIDRAYDLGVNSYLVKPTRLAELIDMMTGLRKYWLDLNYAPQI